MLRAGAQGSGRPARRTEPVWGRRVPRAAARRRTTRWPAPTTGSSPKRQPAPEWAAELEEEWVRREDEGGNGVHRPAELLGLHFEDPAVPHEVASVAGAKGAPEHPESGNVVVEPERATEEHAKGGGF